MTRGGSGGIELVTESVAFRESKDSLRVMLAQISPAYDQAELNSRSVVSVRDPDAQAERILAVVAHAQSAEADVLLFPELVAPSRHRQAIEDALSTTEKDIVACVCYEHTTLSGLRAMVSESEAAQHGLEAPDAETRLVNFCRVFVKSGDDTRVYTQIKLTPFSGEFSLSARSSLFCGRIIRRFVTNWGNFIFLICKDYVGEVGVEGRTPMFDFLKSLTHEGLHYVFVPAMNAEPEAFMHAARAFYYLQEKSSHTFSVFLNAAELDHTTIVFPVRPHPRVRGGGQIEIVPLFESKPAWGTQLRFPGRTERLIAATLVRLDTYTPLPGKMIFSPVHQTESVDFADLGLPVEAPPEAVQTSPAPPEPVAPARHNLPAQPTAFVGREQELEETTRLLADPSCRLITLTGHGGVGKSRLAAQIACDQVQAFPDGVYFVPLAPIGSVEHITSTVADALSFPLSGRQNPKQQLLNFLREKQMLLLMDNFEHVLEGAQLVADILQGAPKVKVLATSRERLNLRGEWTLEVCGLQVPPARDADGAETYSAVQLFVEGARRVRSSFTVDDVERQEVVRICRAVEGMPLAIELASSWVRALTCREILEEIETGLDFLATTARDVPERHRSLRAVFEHSWSLLPDAERDALMRLSLFRGGFQRDAAGKVAGTSLMVLSELVDRSLLRWDPSRRYGMHELLRQYAEAKMGEEPSCLRETRDRYCSYYTTFLREREELLWGLEQREALSDIAEEIENIRRAWNWAVEEEHWDELNGALAGLSRFYDVRGRFNEAYDALTAVEERVRSADQEMLPPEAALLRGRGLARLGFFSHRLGRYDEAEEQLRASLDKLRGIGATKETPPALRGLGSVARLRGSFAEAKRLYEESLAVAEAEGSRLGVVLSLAGLGHVARQLGEYDEAKRFHERCLAIHEEMGDLRGKAVCSMNMANVSQALGNYAEAARHYRETLEVAEEINDRRLAASALNNLGTVESRLGEYEEARRLYRQCLSMSKELGDRRLVAFSLSNLGSVAAMLGEYTQAKQLNQESLRAYEELGDREGVAYALIGLGDAARGLGEHEESRKFLRQALDVASDLGATPVALEAFGVAAKLLSDTGDERAGLKVAAFVAGHAAAEKGAKDRAERLRSSLAAVLPPEAVKAAEWMVKTADVESLARELFGQGSDKKT
jgi:predicted ATPase/predicted amidohydrolase